VIVMKFGGSSIASAAAIEWVAGIVQARLDEQPVVVVSAMGKTTDRLLEALQYAAQGRPIQRGAASKTCVNIISRRHNGCWEQRPAHSWKVAWLRCSVSCIRF
jgi:aspartokinase